MGVTLHDRGLGQDFIAKTLKSSVHNKIDKTTSSKFKIFVFLKMYLQNEKISYRLGENICKIYMYD